MWLHTTWLFKDEEVNCSLLKLCQPSDEKIASMTNFLEAIFEKQSACHNKTIATREDIAAELEGYIRKEFPGTCVLCAAACTGMRTTSCIAIVTLTASSDSMLTRGTSTTQCNLQIGVTASTKRASIGHDGIVNPVCRCDCWTAWLQFFRICATNQWRKHLLVYSWTWIAPPGILFVHCRISISSHFVVCRPCPRCRL